MKYTHKQLIDAVPHCTSIRQLLSVLGLAERGGNYKTLNKKFKELNIDTSHFTGQAHAKGKTFKTKQIPVSDHLKYGTAIGSSRLRLMLLRDGYFPHECSMCHLTNWLDAPIPLELDHINGDNIDNQLHNLRLLCPNCHALTPTYRGKNQRRTK